MKILCETHIQQLESTCLFYLAKHSKYSHLSIAFVFGILHFGRLYLDYFINNRIIQNEGLRTILLICEEEIMSKGICEWVE